MPAIRTRIGLPLITGANNCDLKNSFSAAANLSNTLILISPCPCPCPYLYQCPCPCPCLYQCPCPCPSPVLSSYVHLPVFISIFLFLIHVHIPGLVLVPVFALCPYSCDFFIIDIFSKLPHKNDFVLLKNQQQYKIVNIIPIHSSIHE